MNWIIVILFLGQAVVDFLVNGFIWRALFYLFSALINLCVIYMK
jgi:hypothetical protein